MVSSGRIELRHDGGREVIAVAEAGALIGEIALFIENKRPATATATVASQVLEIDRELITRMLNEYPTIAVRLRASLAQRLTSTVAELDRVRERLVAIERSQRR